MISSKTSYKCGKYIILITEPIGGNWEICIAKLTSPYETIGHGSSFAIVDAVYDAASEAIEHVGMVESDVKDILYLVIQAAHICTLDMS
jgi:hypothetical protein